MIVKSLGQRGSGSIGRVLDYITRPNAAMRDAKGAPILLRHNIRGKDLESLKAAFLANELSRINTPSGRLYAYHDIIAFTKDDAQRIDTKMLEDLTREYLCQRAETGMAVATFHDDKDHMHVHVLLGSTEIATGKALRLSRAEFAKVKESLQQYQLSKYPELASVVEHGKGKQYALENEYRMNGRTRKPSRKDEIRQMLNTAFESSYSKEEFYANMKEAGLNLYERNGVTGVCDNRNYRLNTLGFGEESMAELDKREERMQQLGGKETDRELEQEKNEGKTKEERENLNNDKDY